MTLVAVIRIAVIVFVLLAVAIFVFLGGEDDL